MQLIGKSKLMKHKSKNIGNSKLCSEIDLLITDLETNDFKKPEDLLRVRKDADCVHSDGFYFFNLNIHRSLILIEFGLDGMGTVCWVGSHDEYELTFKNNRNTIKKWLISKNYL